MPKIADKEIIGRFTIPSGIITTTADSILRIAQEIPEIGILTTKSVGPVEKEGNKEPILASLGDGTFINAVGLANPGAEEFASEIKEIHPLPNGKFLMTSISAVIFPVRVPTFVKKTLGFSRLPAFRATLAAV